MRLASQASYAGSIFTLIALPTLSLGVFTFSACSDSTEPVLPAAVWSITGNDEDVVVNGDVTLVAGVTDQNDRWIGGVTVTWEIIEGDGTLSASSSVTDASGEAEVVFTAGAMAGVVVVTATVAGLDPATFTINVVVDAAQSEGLTGVPVWTPMLESRTASRV